MTSTLHYRPSVRAPLFWLPAGFEPSEVLPPNLRRREDDARWLVSTILRKEAYRNTDEHGYTRLRSTVLRRVMSKRTQPAVVRALVEAGVLDPPSPHCAGVRSKGYRLTKMYLAEPFKQVEAKDRKLINRIDRERERMHQEQMVRWLPIHHELSRVQRFVTILPSADATLANLVPEARLCQGILVEDIRRRCFKFTVSTTGRCFNWLTGLKRTLRPAIRLAGEPIIGVDIKCAQPALLAVLMRLSEGRDVPTYKDTCLLLPSPAGDDVRPLSPCQRNALGFTFVVDSLGSSPTLGYDCLSFEELVFHGELYERLIELCHSKGVELPKPPEDRDRVKLWLLRDVLAKKGDYPSDFAGVFREAFPSVHRFVRWVNRNNYAELIRSLQRLESWLVIETVAPRLVGRVPILTLHDAIYSRVQDVAVVRDAFQETFDDLGIRMAVKVDAAPGPESLLPPRQHERRKNDDCQAD